MKYVLITTAITCNKIHNLRVFYDQELYWMLYIMSFNTYNKVLLFPFINKKSPEKLRICSRLPSWQRLNMNLSQPDSRACAFNHQVISPPTFQWLATWLLWSSGCQRDLLIVLEPWTLPLIFFWVELLMKEKGGEGATGSHCPSGHQEDCSSPGYARVNHRNGLGGREPEFQSGVLP